MLGIPATCFGIPLQPFLQLNLLRLPLDYQRGLELNSTGDPRLAFEPLERNQTELKKITDLALRNAMKIKNFNGSLQVSPAAHAEADMIEPHAILIESIIRTSLSGVRCGAVSKQDGSVAK